jgi:mannosyltransferase OCH1-like enzyme
LISKYDFPANYHKWKETFSTHNPNFERRLWDDADNEAFISKEFPWFLKTYKGYPREIFRADVVRYFFLYKFGGIYADMDVECLRPLNALLDQGDVLLGRMGSNAAHPHSIPNAIMASKPFQDFWLLVISLLVASANKIGEPDEITGPVILKTAFDLYVADDPSVRPMIDEILALLPPALQAQSRKTKILLLDSEQWFPVDWTNPSDQMLRNEVLNVGLLSEKRKRELFPESWMVTYWTHYW